MRTRACTYLAISNRAFCISTVALDDDGEATNNTCGGGGGADAGDTSGRLSMRAGVMGGGGAAAAAPAAVAAVAERVATPRLRLSGRPTTALGGTLGGALASSL